MARRRKFQIECHAGGNYTVRWGYHTYEIDRTGRRWCVWKLTTWNEFPILVEIAKSFKAAKAVIRKRR